MKFSVLKTALSAERPAAIDADAIADEDCLSLAPLLCPEIIRIINDHNLSAYRSGSFNGGRKAK